MRTKLFVLAMAAALAVTTACRDITNVNVEVSVIGSGTDTTSGGCIVTTTVVSVGGSGVAGGGTLSLTPGSTTEVVASASGSPPTCVTTQAFTWETSNAARVTVVSVDPSTGRLTAVSSGTAQITAVHTETGARFTFTVVVGTASSVSSITFTSSAGASTARPVGAIDTLTAVCTRGTDVSVDCLPAWSSSSSGRITVLATDSLFLDGAWRRVGTRAIIRYWAATTPGESVGICVYWTRTVTTPRFCQSRTVTP